MIDALFVAVAIFAQSASVAAPAAAPPRSQAPPSQAPPSQAPPSQAPHDVSGVTVTSPKKPQLDPKEVVCHSEMPIGSRFPQKICASREAIAERRQIDQMEVRRWTALRPGSGN